MKYLIGIDVGGTATKAGIFKEDGTLIDKWSIDTEIGDNGIHIYDDSTALIREKMEEFSIKQKDVLGVGIDMPGPVYADGHLGKCSNIFITGGYPAEEISRRLSGIKAVAANDANAAAFGEMWQGAGKGYSSVCMVTLGTGVGGGIIMDGEIIAGCHGAAGEIGHIKVEDRETEVCNCGGKGCCEYYASATGLVRVAKRIAANGDPLRPFVPGQEILHPESGISRFGEELTAKDVCDLARDGDACAIEAVDFSMDKLARALGYVSYVADPEVFVIGGGVSKSSDILLPLLNEKIVQYTPLVREKERNVISAKLGNDAGMYGAAALALYKIF